MELGGETGVSSHAPTGGVSPSVSAEVCLVDSQECYAVKISAPIFEFNVIFAPAEVARLARVRQTPWLTGALEIGRSAGSPVWWSVDEDDSPYLSILIGHDDQTWDIGFTLPLTTLDSVLREIEQLQRESDQPRG
jgi:hypothetical protein